MWLVRVADKGGDRTVVPRDTLAASAQSLRATVHSLRVSHDRQIAARFSGVGAKSVSDRAKETNIKEAAFATMRDQYNAAFYKLLEKKRITVTVNLNGGESAGVSLQEYDRPLEDVLEITSYPEDGDVSLTAAQMQHVDPVLCGHSSVVEATAATDHTCASMVEDCVHLQRLIWHVLHGIDPEPAHIFVKSDYGAHATGIWTYLLAKRGQVYRIVDAAAAQVKNIVYTPATGVLVITLTNGDHMAFERKVKLPTRYGNNYVEKKDDYSFGTTMAAIWPAPHIVLTDDGTPAYIDKDDNKTAFNNSWFEASPVNPDGIISGALYVPWAANVAARKTFVDLDVFRPDAFGFDDAFPVDVGTIDNTKFVNALKNGCPSNEEELRTNFVHLTKLRGAELDPSAQTVGMMQNTVSRKRRRPTDDQTQLDKDLQERIRLPQR